MEIICPVRKCVWGSINSLDDLKKYVAKSGQFFGQDLSGPASNYDPSYPSDQTFYQYMGWGLHQGLDIPCETGTEVYASHDGTVVKLSDSLSAGIGVVIDGVDIRTVYWHLKEYNVVIGQQVKMGELIALSDNTGWSAGPHLHWEYKVRQGNDYVAVDPIPHIVFKKPMDEQDVKSLQALEGYQDPDGVQYWVGKPLSEYLKIRLADKVKQIQDLNGNI